MEYIIIGFLVIVPLLLIYRLYKSANELSIIDKGENSVTLSPVIHRILFLSRPRPVLRLSVVFQLVVTVPYIVIVPMLYTICALWITHKIKVPSYINFNILMYMYIFPIIYIEIAYFIFGFIKKMTKGNEIDEIKFSINIPFKAIFFIIGIPSFVIVSLFIILQA